MVTYLRTVLRSFIKDERGASLVEYGLIIGLIAVFLIVGLTALGGGLSTLFGNVTTAVEDAG